MLIVDERDGDGNEAAIEAGIDERLTLRKMAPTIHMPYTASGAMDVPLAQGITLQQVADEFVVHLNSVENWGQRWDEFGLVGLFESRHTGRSPKLSD